MLSEKLIHFPETDPGSICPNDAIRTQIEAHIDHFLNKGGKIHKIGNGVMAGKIKANRTKAELIAYHKQSFTERRMRWDIGDFAYNGAIIGDIPHRLP